MPTFARVLLCGCIALLVGCPSDELDDTDAGASVTGTFTVLSYNVAGLPMEFSNEKPGEHLQLISPLLDDYDIVLTQEDFDWWVEALDMLDFVHYHERLRAEAHHAHRTEQHPGPDAVGLDLSVRPSPTIGDGLGFLSEYPFDDVVRVPWADCFGGIDGSDMGAADCLAMKGFMVGTFELAEGASVDIYTLHAEAGGSETDQALQADDFRDLAAFIAKHSKGRAVILGGDTNLHTGADHADASGNADATIWRTFLKSTSLTDACETLDCDDPGAIDKMAFRSGGGVSLEALEHRFATNEFRAPTGEALSDHPPLVVKFRFGAR